MSQPENQTAETNLTEEEATRYDRQMRLWGIEAQQRYRSLCQRSMGKNYHVAMQDEKCRNFGREVERRSHGSH